MGGPLRMLLETHAMLGPERLYVRRPCILAAGSLEARKNFPLPVEAFGLCVKRGGPARDTSLVMAGSVPREKLLATVNAEWDDASMRLTGGVARASLFCWPETGRRTLAVCRRAAS